MAYRLDEDHVEEILADLDVRERGGYVRTEIDAHIGRAGRKVGGGGRTHKAGVVESACFGSRRYLVALSIKNVEAERLAKELARERGTTVTGAVIGALDDALRRTRGRKVAPSIRDAILDISERCAALPDLDTRTADEILGYDERGGFG